MLGHVLQKLFEAGARDAFFVPVMMKKNRPAQELVVITDDAHRESLETILFEETTTIGIRRQRMSRTVLPRSAETVETPFGTVQVKRIVLNGRARLYPEYDAIAQICDETGESFPDVFAAVQTICQQKMEWEQLSQF